MRTYLWKPVPLDKCAQQTFNSGARLTPRGATKVHCLHSDICSCSIVVTSAKTERRNGECVFSPDPPIPALPTTVIQEARDDQDQSVTGLRIGVVLQAVAGGQTVDW